MKTQKKMRADLLLNPLGQTLILRVSFGLPFGLIFGLMVLVLLAPGCTPPPSTPSLGEQSFDFPETRFLTAKGGGDTEADARRQALAELSSIFESSIQSQTTSLATSSLGPDNVELFEKTIKSRIQVISSVRLEGAKIGTTWQDAATGNFHALAVLDRMDAGRNWSNEMERLDNRLRAEAFALETITGQLSRMAALNRIISMAIERHSLESRMMVIDYPTSKLELDLSPIFLELAAIQSKLRFYIDITGEHGTIAGKILSQALSQNRILITLDMDKADAWVMGRVEVTPMSLANPKIVFVRAAGNVEVFETDSHDLFTDITENLRKGHVDQNEATHKAVMAISQRISQRLLSTLGLDQPQAKESVQ